MPLEGLNELKIKIKVEVKDDRLRRSIVGLGAQRDFSVSSGGVSVHFKDLKSALIEKIEANTGSVMVGCVAWFTEIDILQAIRRHSVASSFIINKKDFKNVFKLQKDQWIACKEYFRKFSPFWLDDGDFAEPLPRVFETISEKGSKFEAFRCCGRAKVDNDFPWFMHNKFIVFCDYEEGYMTREDDQYDTRHFSQVTPKSVWTGSMNFTNNAANNFENAVHIDDPQIAAAYFGEWGQIAALSEPLDWEAQEPTSDRSYPPLDWAELVRALSKDKGEF